MNVTYSTYSTFTR